MSTTKQEPVEILWDVDEGVIVIGEDLEFRVSESTDAYRLTEYLRSKGVVVRFTNHDAGMTEER